MGSPRRLLGVTAAAALVLTMSGCSLDTVIWGADGAGVIRTTESLIDAAAAGDADSFVCAGYEPELGEPTDWEGLSADEPERFVPEYWPEMTEHDPDWSINLSFAEEQVAAGAAFPGDVFYQETDDGPCLVAVAWWTVEG